MKNIITLLLAVFSTVYAGHSQTVDTVSISTKKSLERKNNGFQLVTIKTVRVAVVAPKPDKGYSRYDYNYNGDTKDTFVKEYQYQKVDSVFPIKNVGYSAFVDNNAYIAAYAHPGVKVLNEKEEEFTNYSNYFLTKEVGAKRFWTIYHPETKMFEFGVDVKSETSVPWVRILLFVLILLSCGVASYTTKASAFEGMFDSSHGLLNQCMNISYQIIFIWLIIFSVLVSGSAFLIIFGTDFGNSISENERIVAFIVRFVIIVLLSFRARSVKKWKEEEKKQKAEYLKTQLVDAFDDGRE